jgi:hypothetical protein
MTTSDPTSSQLLQEARSVDTCAERLQELNRADPALGPQIASNPSAPIELLDQLALQCPTEVLANPVLQLRALETGGAYGELSLRSMVCLCLASNPKRDADLLRETRRRIQSSIEELRAQDYASLDCDWLYARHFTLLPEDCDGVIEKPLGFFLEVRANMYAKGTISLYDIPGLDDAGLGRPVSQRTSLVEFMRAVVAGEIRDYINEEYLSREDGGSTDVTLSAEELPAGYSLDHNTLYKDDESILSIYHDFSGGDSPVVYGDGYLTVPVEFQDEVNHCIEIAMGELGDLTGLESKCPFLPADWHLRLAALLIP